MPGGDKTGPLGRGPLTGRGAGYCTGNDRPGSFEPGPGGGRRRGGFGRGRGLGRPGRGRPPEIPDGSGTGAARETTARRDPERGELDEIRDRLRRLEEDRDGHDE